MMGKLSSKWDIQCEKDKDWSILQTPNKKAEKSNGQTFVGKTMYWIESDI